RRDHLVPLQRGFANQVHTLPVVCVGTVGIGGDDLVECGNGVIDFAGVREHRAGVEVILPGRWGIDLCRLRVGLHGIIGLSGLGICFCKVVVISRETLGCIGVFVIRDPLLQFHRFLIGLDGGIQTLLLFRRIGLLVGRESIRISQLEPDQVATGVHLVGLIQRRNRSVVVLTLDRGVSRGQFLVQGLDSVDLFLLLLLLLLHLLYLLRR